MTILDFLNEDFTIIELAGALKLLREFKKCHTSHEDLTPPLVAWSKLEQLEEYLDYMLYKTPLKNDTLEYIKQENFKLEGDES
jgi:hypothetical protein